MDENVQNDDNEQAQAFDISMLDTYSLLGIFINLLGMQAWRDMGLHTNPKTNELTVDYERASTAIDCIEFLIKKLEPKVDPNEQPKLKSLLSDLQINFVRQSEQKKSE